MYPMMKYRLMHTPEMYDRVFNRAATECASLPLDVRAEGDDFVITASVPGLRAEDVSVEVLGERVSIRGEISAPPAAEEAEWFLRERGYGKFARTLKFPAELDGAQAAATVEHGVLTLRLPKAETAKPKQIKVTAK
jgi:HSP20 family protein